MRSTQFALTVLLVKSVTTTISPKSLPEHHVQTDSTVPPEVRPKRPSVALWELMDPLMVYEMSVGVSHALNHITERMQQDHWEIQVLQLGMFRGAVSTAMHVLAEQ